MIRQRLPFPRDPYWLAARFSSDCAKCGRTIKAGEQIYYFPNSKTVFCDADDCGQHEARQINAALQDERMFAL